MGESTFVAFQLLYAIKILKIYAEDRNDSDYIKDLDEVFAKVSDILNSQCWNGDRWIRGFKEDGTVIGKQGDPEASMWLNPQSWGIISGMSTKEQAIASMDSVYRELNTPYGIMVMYPAYENHAFQGALMLCFNNGVKENAGIFSQPQGWAILAEALLGRGDRAFEYWKECSPAYMNDKAETRVIEPYVHGQFTEGRQSPFAGRSHVHWLTGTASTVMVGTVEGILGLRPQLHGLLINPSIPAEWQGFEMVKIFRGKKLNIKVENPSGVTSGVKSVTVNGAALEGLLIEEAILKDVNDITVIMGQ
jgi:cellobiose phosphorylase